MRRPAARLDLPDLRREAPAPRSSSSSSSPTRAASRSPARRRSSRSRSRASPRSRTSSSPASTAGRSSRRRSSATLHDGRRHRHGLVSTELYGESTDRRDADLRQVGRGAARAIDADTRRPRAATCELVAMWHCPHCGAPQAETARCWVCRRSSTTCSTCRHFRTLPRGRPRLLRPRPRRTPADRARAARLLGGARRARPSPSAAWMPSSASAAGARGRGTAPAAPGDAPSRSRPRARPSSPIERSARLADRRLEPPPADAVRERRPPTRRRRSSIRSPTRLGRAGRACSATASAEPRRRGRALGHRGSAGQVSARAGRPSVRSISLPGGRCAPGGRILPTTTAASSFGPEMLPTVEAVVLDLDLRRRRGARSGSRRPDRRGRRRRRGRAAAGRGRRRRRRGRRRGLGRRRRASASARGPSRRRS